MKVSWRDFNAGAGAVAVSNRAGGFQFPLAPTAESFQRVDKGHRHALINGGEEVIMKSTFLKRVKTLLALVALVIAMAAFGSTTALAAEHYSGRGFVGGHGGGFSGGHSYTGGASHEGAATSEGGAPAGHSMVAEDIMADADTTDRATMAEASV